MFHGGGVGDGEAGGGAGLVFAGDEEGVGGGGGAVVVVGGDEVGEGGGEGRED